MRLSKVRYTAIFRWDASRRHLAVYYRVTPRLGLVPAEVQFAHRGVEYSTGRLLSLLPVSDASRMPALALDEAHWDVAANVRNARFRKLTELLERLRRDPASAPDAS